jgi:hypothetical protein
MGSALPADTEASDTPVSVYRERFPDHPRLCDGDWNPDNRGWLVDFQGESLSEHRHL